MGCSMKELKIPNIIQRKHPHLQTRHIESGMLLPLRLEASGLLAHVTQITLYLQHLKNRRATKHWVEEITNPL